MHFRNRAYEVFNPVASNANKVTQYNFSGLMSHYVHTVRRNSIFGGRIKAQGLIQCCVNTRGKHPA